MKKLMTLTSLFILSCTSNNSQPTPSATPSAMIANPAATFCIQQGGTLTIRKENGGDAGYCTFDDKSECEEWKLYKGECQKGQNKSQQVGSPVSINSKASFGNI